LIPHIVPAMAAPVLFFAHHAALIRRLRSVLQLPHLVSNT
jgi:hypothetical protein